MTLPYGTGNGEGCASHANESLAPEDVARLRMALPENPMVITAVLILERPLPRTELATVIERRLLHNERFRRRIVESRVGSPRWQDVALDLREHCRWHTAQPEGRSLETFIEGRLQEPLRADRPLWRLDVLEAMEGGAAALVFRVHHVIADGAALVTTLRGLADEGTESGEGPGQPGDAATAEVGRHGPGRLLRLLEGLGGAARLAFRAPDPAMNPSARFGTAKRFAYSSRLSLPNLAACAHAADATITEMLLAAVASALRARTACHSPARDVVRHALVPVSLHGSTRRGAGNDYASVLVALPVGDLARPERLRVIQRALQTARAAGALRAGARLVGAAGAVGRALERRIVSLFSLRASVVVSSLRGPGSPMRVGGVPLRDVLVWAPAPGHVPLSVTLMSYAGGVRIGVSADALTIGDPAPIVDVVERELGGPGRRA